LPNSGGGNGVTEKTMTGQQLFSRKWLNSSRQADFQGIALEGRGDVGQAMFMSRNLSAPGPMDSRFGRRWVSCRAAL
jgi:hypothetical protein